MLTTILKKLNGTSTISRRLFLTAAVAAIGMTAATMAAPQKSFAQEAPEALVKAAQAEGEVTWYTAATENVASQLAAAFEKKYGVKVRFLRLGSSPLLQRYATEAESGNIVADLIMTGGNAIPFAQHGIEKGWVDPIGKTDLPAMTSGEYPAKFNRDVAALVQVQLWVLAYNTDNVTEADAPKDWADMLDPKYKDKIIMPDPSASDAYLEFWSLIESKYGVDFLTKLNAQSLRRFDAGVPAIQALSAGEGSLQAPVTTPQAAALQDKGAPLGLVTPSFTTGVEMHLILTKADKMKHPNAGRLLANYLLSTEGNKQLNSGKGTISVYDTTSFPAEYKSPTQVTAEKKEEIRKALGF